MWLVCDWPGTQKRFFLPLIIIQNAPTVPNQLQVTPLWRHCPCFQASIFTGVTKHHPFPNPLRRAVLRNLPHPQPFRLITYSQMKSWPPSRIPMHKKKQVLFKSTNGVTYMMMDERITVAQWRHSVGNGRIAWKHDEQFESTVQGSVSLAFSSRDAH